MDEQFLDFNENVNFWRLFLFSVNIERTFFGG